MCFVQVHNLAGIEKPSTSQHGFQLPAACNTNLVNSIFHDELAVKVNPEDLKVPSLGLRAGEDVHALLACVEGNPISMAPCMQFLLTLLVLA